MDLGKRNKKITEIVLDGCKEWIWSHTASNLGPQNGYLFSAYLPVQHQFPFEGNLNNNLLPFPLRRQSSIILFFFFRLFLVQIWLNPLKLQSLARNLKLVQWLV